MKVCWLFNIFNDMIGIQFSKEVCNFLYDMMGVLETHQRGALLLNSFFVWLSIQLHYKMLLLSIFKTILFLFILVHGKKDEESFLNKSQYHSFTKLPVFWVYYTPDAESKILGIPYYPPAQQLQKRHLDFEGKSNHQNIQVN